MAFKGQVDILDDSGRAVASGWISGSYTKVINTQYAERIAVQVIAAGAAPGTGNLQAYGTGVIGVFVMPAASGSSVNYYGPGFSGTNNILVPDQVKVTVSGAANFRVITFGR